MVLGGGWPAMRMEARRTCSSRRRSYNSELISRDDGSSQQRTLQRNRAHPRLMTAPSVKTNHRISKNRAVAIHSAPIFTAISQRRMRLRRAHPGRLQPLWLPVQSPGESPTGQPRPSAPLPSALQSFVRNSGTRQHLSSNTRVSEDPASPSTRHKQEALAGSA